MKSLGKFKVRIRIVEELTSGTSCKMEDGGLKRNIAIMEVFERGLVVPTKSHPFASEEICEGQPNRMVECVRIDGRWFIVRPDDDMSLPHQYTLTLPQEYFGNVRFLEPNDHTKLIIPLCTLV